MSTSLPETVAAERRELAEVLDGTVLFELARSASRFDRMAHTVARRDARLPAADLTAALRDNTHHPWRPPGHGLDAPLTHDVVHGLDVTAALGLGREVPSQHLLPVLERLATPQSRWYFGVGLETSSYGLTTLAWFLAPACR